MAGTVNYLYDPNQPVWTITECGVKQGRVVRFSAEVTSTGTKAKYDVAISNELGTISLEEEDVFADLSSAIVEYEARLAL